MQPRRSVRKTTTPARFGFGNESDTNDTPLPSVETVKEETFEDAAEQLTREPASTVDAQTVNVTSMDFSAEQQAHIDEMIQRAVQATIATITKETPRQTSRALTADLQPTPDYYLPQIDQSIRSVEPSKVRYPRVPFSDHKGEIEYDAWKMEMKLFMEDYSGNFKTGNSQVKAYFKCTTGEAKTIILQHMDPDFTTAFDSAADVLKALDERFFDHNRVQAAKAKYKNLEMGSMTYNDFRIKFTSYAMTGKISRTRWFEDVCEKVSPALKRDLRIEKYKMDSNYATLDEFLAVADRESRNISAEEVSLARKTTVTFNDTRGILKKDNWKPSSPVTSPAVRTRSPSPAPHAFPRQQESPARAALTSGDTCHYCQKAGHWMTDCPERRRHASIEKKIAELVVSRELKDDDLSENS